MAKPLTKAERRLKTRQAAYELSARRGNTAKATKRPGSMNRHKSAPA